MRASGRQNDELRSISFTRNVNKYAEGSCLVKFGDTHVLCTATVEEKLPLFLRSSQQGWLTAEYNMLPRSTHIRSRRDNNNKPNGRSLEIQRLIGRSLRSVMDLKALGERQIIIDCDVLQADGGTRTAAITGGWVALYDCLGRLQARQLLSRARVLKEQVVALSCGLYRDETLLDLDYSEDSNAQADANFVFSGQQELIEIQATGEQKPLSFKQFNEFIALAQKGAAQLLELQRAAL